MDFLHTFTYLICRSWYIEDSGQCPNILYHQFIVDMPNDPLVFIDGVTKS